MKTHCTTADIGKRGERIAARYLRRHGHRILARNLHCGKNELDLIAKNREFLVFVEVKTRSFLTREEAADHPPALAVHAEKRRRTIEAARQYLREHPTNRIPRLDVIEVYLDRSKHQKPFDIHHIEGAFDAHGRIL